MEKDKKRKESREVAMRREGKIKKKRCSVSWMIENKGYERDIQEEVRGQVQQAFLQQREVFVVFLP